MPKEQNLTIQAERDPDAGIISGSACRIMQEKIEKAVKKEIEILHENADAIEQYRLATMEECEMAFIDSV